jgi:GGDEF domain-containing protein
MSHQLPDRIQLVTAVDALLSDGDLPAIFTVAINGYSDLLAKSGTSASQALIEIADRLRMITRDDDVLALIAPGVFAFMGNAIEPVDASVIQQRLQGGFAMPVDLGEEVVSFPVTVGVAYAESGITGSRLLADAEQDLRSRMP